MKEEVTKQAVSINYDNNGKANGVKVQTLDECFVIALHDLDGGKSDFSHDSAMKRLEELGLKTVNKKQATILCAYLDEVNEKLKEAGGEPFAKDVYVTSSSADFDRNFSWFFGGFIGCLNYDNCCRDYYLCRPIENIKN